MTNQPIHPSDPAANLTGARDALPFERRTSTRNPSNGSAAILYSDGQGRVGLSNATFIDTSGAGVGVQCQSAIEPGMLVTLYPTRPGSHAINAVAARCQEDGECWRVGLTVLARAAA